MKQIIANLLMISSIISLCAMELEQKSQKPKKKLITQYGKTSKTSEYVYVKGMCGKVIDVDRDKIKHMHVLSLVQAHQKAGNIINLFSIHEDAQKDAPFIRTSDIGIVLTAIDACEKNIFEDYCSSLITLKKVTHSPVTHTCDITNLSDLINASYKVGAYRIFQRCARHLLILDMQHRIAHTPLLSVDRLLETIGQQISLCKMGNLLGDIKDRTDSASMVTFIINCLKQAIVRKRVPFRGITLPELPTWNINTTTISPDSSTIVAGGWGFKDNLGVWSAHTGKPLKRLNGHPESVDVALFSPDGKILFSVGISGEMCWWDTATWTNVKKIDGKFYNPSIGAFSCDGSLIAVGGIYFRDNLIIINAKTGEQLQEWTADNNPIVTVGFSPDNSKMVTVSHNATDKNNYIRIWNITKKDPSLLKEIIEYDCSSCSVEYGNGKWFLTGYRNTIGYWFSYDLDQCRSCQYDSLIRLKHGEALPSVGVIARVPGTPHLFVADVDSNHISAFDLLSGKFIQKFCGGQGKMRRLVCSNDGKLLVSVNNNAENSLILWPLLIKEEQQTLEQIGTSAIDDVGLMHDICLAGHKQPTIQFKRNSAHVLPFDRLKIPVQELFKGCLLDNQFFVDGDFVLTERNGEIDEGWFAV